MLAASVGAEGTDHGGYLFDRSQLHVFVGSYKRKRVDKMFLHYPVEIMGKNPLNLYEDSQSAIASAMIPKFHKRIKLIGSRYNFMLEKVSTDMWSIYDA